MLGASKKFFGTLTGPPVQCDVCQLGDPSAMNFPRASHDWRIVGNGIDVEIFLCRSSFTHIRRSGLQHQLPFRAFVWLFANNLVMRLLASAFLTPPNWRQVWVHMVGLLNMASAAASDEQLRNDVLDRTIGHFSG